MACMYNGVLLSHKKSENLPSAANTIWYHYMISLYDITCHLQQTLYDMIWNQKIQQTSDYKDKEAVMWI